MNSRPYSPEARRTLAADALSSLSDQVAILDRAGTILAVNEPWNAFAAANGVPDVAAVGRTVNYLDVCAKAARAGVPDAARARAGIEAVCQRRLAAFELEYRCEGPVEPAWFLMSVTPFRHAQGGAVVSHRNMNAWIPDKIVARERALSRLAEIKVRNLSGRLAAAQEEERRRIGRELHDDVNQRLALLAMGIEEVSVLIHDRTISARLHDLWTKTTELSKGVQNLSRELHGCTLGALGIVTAIRALRRDLASKGFRIAVIGCDRPIDLPQASAWCLFRIAQEALNNVFKHSGTREATVTLTDTERSVRLLVEDHGRGFDPQRQHNGLGLLSMRERIAFAGGTLRIRARPGQGTAVHARVLRGVSPRAETGFFDLRRDA
jgi:signal transduction histidine kinase